LVFAIAWMGTRDIYIAVGIVCLFILIVDYLCNEKSTFCILPENFVDLHVEKLDEMNESITPQDLQNIKNLAKKIEAEFHDEKKENNENKEQTNSDIPVNPYNGFQVSSFT
jgi:hypothetical protein